MGTGGCGHVFYDGRSLSCDWLRAYDSLVAERHNFIRCCTAWASVLLIVGIPIMILGGHFMDLRERKHQAWQPP